MAKSKVSAPSGATVTPIRRDLSLVPPTPHQYTIEILETALMRARTGRCIGVVLTLMEPGGKEDHIVTGPYRDRPAEAIRAAMAVSFLLTKSEVARRDAP